MDVFDFSEIVLKEGFKCDYEPTYCSTHGAFAYAIFPTNDFEKCDKKPALHQQFCNTKNGTEVQIQL